MERNIKIYTGVGGYNLFEETFEEITLGTKRVYIGKKIPRILRKVHKNICKSVNGIYFYRIKK